MGDTMLIGVLRMPPDLWSRDPMDIKQRHGRYIQAADRIEKDADRITALETALHDCITHMHTAGDPKAIEAADRAAELLGVAE